MARCEQYRVVSWYQRRCDEQAAFKVTTRVIFLDGGHQDVTQYLCAGCARTAQQHRTKLDTHQYYNDADLDHTFPIVERVGQTAPEGR